MFSEGSCVGGKYFGVVGCWNSTLLPNRVLVANVFHGFEFVCLKLTAELGLGRYYCRWSQVLVGNVVDGVSCWWLVLSGLVVSVV